MSNTLTQPGRRREFVWALGIAALVIGVALLLPPAGKPSQPAWALAAHLSAALIALPLGAWVLFFSQKGSKRHKQAGYLWVALMLVAAFSAFFIQSWGRFSPIHLFSVWTPISLVLAIRAARRGDIEAHQGYMRGTYIGLVVAGLLAVVLPGRFLWRFVAGLLA